MLTKQKVDQIKAALIQIESARLAVMRCEPMQQTSQQTAIAWADTHLREAENQLVKLLRVERLEYPSPRRA